MHDVHSPDYSKYMDIQQAINFILYGDFEKAGISMAFPVRTVMLQLTPNDSAASGAIAAAHTRRSNVTDANESNTGLPVERESTVSTK
ncbi:MAG: hypothetical protein ABI035_03715 [Gemmatimonadaceae bacterium]